MVKTKTKPPTKIERPAREPRPCTADIPTLGRRVEPRMREVEEPIVMEDGRPMLSNSGNSVVRRREVEQMVETIQSGLDYDEALSLGDQKWRPFIDGKYTCGVGGRRFVIDQETYDKLCQA